MMQIALLLACVSLALGFSPERLHRESRRLIVGGKEVPVGSRPYQVALLETRNPNTQYCGGTLVHERWVVTAAHCYGGVKEAFVGLGFHNLKDKTNTQIIKGKWVVHGTFQYSTLNRDIALIKLDEAATLNDNVQFIKVTSAYSEVPSGTPLLASGWGAIDADSTYPNEMRQVVVSAVPRSDCENVYIEDPITEYMFCASASGKDSCQGDSGGPLVSNFDENKHIDGVVLEGIVSWGYDCADPAYPGVYTKVSLFCGWLKRKTSGDVTCG